MKIAVVTTSNNRKEKTILCLKSIYSQELYLCGEVEIDVYICDDGSTDNTSGIIKSLFPDVHIILGNGNLFWARGISLALKEALKTYHDFYLMVNDDVIFSNYMLEQMVQAYNETKDLAGHVAIVGSTKDSKTGEWTYGGQLWNKKIIHEKYIPVLPGRPYKECNMVNWNCFLIPNKMIEALGTIDDYYEHGKADNDYSNRIINSGNKMFVASEYIGVCERNSLLNTWRDVSLPLKRRLQLVQKKTGLPLKSELHYCLKFHGYYWLIWFLKRYIWIVKSSILKK